LSGLENEDLKT